MAFNRNRTAAAPVQQPPQTQATVAAPVQQPQQQSKYAKVAGARAARGANYMRPGHYLARIEAVREDKAFKKGDYVAIEMTVVATFADAVQGFDYNRKVQLPFHGVGENVSDVIMQTNIAAESRIKAFAMAAGDLTEEDFQSEAYPGATIDELVGETQPVAGAVVEIRAQTVIKKESRAKAESALTNDDIYTRLDYVRRVSFAETKTLLEPKVIDRLFPDLEAQIAEEQAS